MNRRSVLAVGAAALAGCGDAVEGPDAREAETLIAEGITDVRDSEGLPPLSTREPLRTAAREHSRDMAERDFYRHENPDGEGPSARAGCRAGEVIHRGEIGDMRNRGSDQEWYTRDTDELAGYVIEGWTISDAHRRQLVSRQYSAIGVGVHVADGEFFATAVFC